MGSDHHYPEEAPAHDVAVDGFWIDRYAVTNASSAASSTATGHVTLAERPPDPADYPGAEPGAARPGVGWCSEAPGSRVDLRNPTTGGPTCRARLAPSARARELAQGEDEAPRRARGVGRRGGLRTWAGKDAAHRGRVGAGGPRRPRRRRVRLGRRADARTVATWPTPGRASSRSENLRSTATSATAPVGSFPPNGYGLLRDGRQRVGVDHRLVPGPRRGRASACCAGHEPARRRPERQLRPGAARMRSPAR